MLKIKINTNTASRKDELYSWMSNKDKPTILLSKPDLKLWKLPSRIILSLPSPKNCWTMLSNSYRKIHPLILLWDSMPLSWPNSKKSRLKSSPILSQVWNLTLIKNYNTTKLNTKPSTIAVKVISKKLLISSYTTTKLKILLKWSASKTKSANLTSPPITSRIVSK